MKKAYEEKVAIGTGVGLHNLKLNRSGLDLNSFSRRVMGPQITDDVDKSDGEVVATDFAENDGGGGGTIHVVSTRNKTILTKPDIFL